MRTSTLPGLFLVLAAACVSVSSVDESVLPCGLGILEQRLPVAGLWTIETSPAPELVTLQPNPALIDGNTSAGAGADLGYGPAVAEDSRLRDLGVQFPAATTAIDELHVWVDRPLPPVVSSSYSWSAYRSEDNVSWTPVPITSPVRFAVTASRFEIPIARTAAPFVKVITRPLALGITADPGFEVILATEVQAFAVVTPTCAVSTAAPE